MLSTTRNSVAHNQQAKLAVDYNELLKELSSQEMTSVGCYTIGETIGQGTFGKVKKGFHKLTGKVVAIKKIGKQHAPMMAREIHHHKQIKHPNVVMLYEMITTESAVHIISEYCPNGDLLDALDLAGGRCSEERVHRWFQQLTDAVYFCHSQHIVHRDLKLENILLDADDNVKICDFGFARYTQKNQYLETFCGSLSYSAPEIIMRKKYTGPETDIWSLGVILYTLLAGEYPFDDDSDVITQRKITQADYQMPYYFSSKLSSLIHNMIQIEPSSRLSAEAILHHPWLTETEDNTLDEGLTPSSSTSSNNSNLSDIDLSPPSITFSQVSPVTHEKSPRFSAPAFNNTRRHSGSRTFRSSLPSSFAQKGKGMSDTEQRLFSALTAAGFDRDALVKMQTGECDTSSTLWHLLLENMTKPSDEVDSVSDAFAYAIENRQQKKSVAVDCGIQTSPVTSRRNSLTSPQPTAVEKEVKHYPKPPVQQRPTIQTVGFGSTNTTRPNDRAGWFSSVKSWFGNTPKPPTEQYSSPMNTKDEDDVIMSPPIYRTGSQKYRRKLLQLSEPPISELDQLTYNGTSFMGSGKSTQQIQQTRTLVPIQSSVVMPPTALTSTRSVADSFSILGEADKEPKEIDICERRYSMLHLQQQPTPPPSPPVVRKKSVEHVSISPIEEKTLDLLPKKKSEPVSLPLPVQPLKLQKPPQPPFVEKPSSFVKKSPSVENTSSFIEKPFIETPPSVEKVIENKDTSPSFRTRTSRFEFTPRSRLSAYGGQEARKLPMSSKTIIEEEEEEE